MTKTKKVYLIRHAQSEAQACSRAERKVSEKLRDAKLSEKGLLDVSHVSMPKGSVEVVLVSPLSRAIQTALVIFGNDDTPIVCVPELSEFASSKKMVGWENAGRELDEVLNDPKLTSMKRFKDIDFSMVKGYHEKNGIEWWTKGYEKEKSTTQIHKLKEILWDRPETKIACVGHCNNIMALLRTWYRIPNNKPIECKLYKTSGGTVKIYKTRKGMFSYLFKRIFRIGGSKSAKVAADPGE